MGKRPGGEQAGKWKEVRSRSRNVRGGCPGSGGPLEILVQNTAVSSVQKKLWRKLLETGQDKSNRSFSFYLEFLPCYPRPWKQYGHFLPLLLPPSLPPLPSFSSSLPPSPPSSSLSRTAPDLVLSWLACTQLDSGSLLLAGRCRRRTRPERGQEERDSRDAGSSTRDDVTGASDRYSFQSPLCLHQ